MTLKFGEPQLGSASAGTVTVEFLEAFADAWNRHDTDAILSMMTSDWRWSTRLIQYVSVS